MPPLTVLHISYSDDFGGSARSSYKIHRGLRELGVRSRMLVKKKLLEDPDVGVMSQRWLRMADLAAASATDRLGLQNVYLPSSARLLKHPWFIEADVVQLYNIHGGYFSHSVLPELSRRKPVVWRLSDMWAFTGHCAYSGSCQKWKTGCQGCPDLQAEPALPRDTAGMLFRRKDRLYARSRIHIVAPSTWIRGLAQESPLLGRFPITYIPNGIETSVFRPLDQSWCRDVLRVPQGRKTVLFIAHDLDSPRKGWAHVKQAIERLWALGQRDLQLMLVGEGAAHWADDLPCPRWRRTYVREDELLAMVYNAADVCIHPAVVENLPNSVLEAMACGVPTVGFDSGGMRDAVAHQETGWLAPHGDVDSLTQGLRSSLADDQHRADVGLRCVAAIRQRFTMERQTQAFLALYQSLALPADPARQAAPAHP